MKILKVLVLFFVLSVAGCDLMGFITVTNNTGSRVQVINQYVDDGGYVYIFSDSLEDIEKKFEMQMLNEHSVSLLKDKTATVTITINIDDIELVEDE